MSVELISIRLESCTTRNRDIPRPKNIILQPSEVVLEAIVQVQLGTPRLRVEDVSALRREPSPFDLDRLGLARAGEASQLCGSSCGEERKAGRGSELHDSSSCANDGLIVESRMGGAGSVTLF